MLSLMIASSLVVAIEQPKEEVALCLARVAAPFAVPSVVSLADRIELIWGRGIRSVSITDKEIITSGGFGHIPKKDLQRCAAKPAISDQTASGKGR